MCNRIGAFLCNQDDFVGFGIVFRELIEQKVERFYIIETTRPEVLAH